MDKIIDYDLSLVSISDEDGGFGRALGFFGSAVVVYEPRIVDGKQMAGRLYLFQHGLFDGSNTDEEQTDVQVETDTNNGIPGFPFISILAALVISYYIRRGIWG